MATIASMTGFARADGSITRTDGVLADSGGDPGGDAGTAWAWELRSVNGRTLELRFRLPNGWDSLEAGWRERAGQALKRGNVTATLTIKRQSESRLELDPAALEQVLKIATDLHHRIPGSAPPSPEALLSLPGVLRQAQSDQKQEKASAAAAVQAGFTAALADLVASRQAEGSRLATVLHRQLTEIAALCETAATQAVGQPAAQRARMLDNLQTLLRETPNLSEERITQEVALLASRSDVREELDRLSSHIAAARDLMGEAVNIGRKLDFLIQEFNREANTLCSKSASVGLTATGLKLKAAIEQLREQVQNIE
ncbi:YicC/YloC family endoribonuclease [Rhodopila sp.]|uniref:YicC/YloC family endoribonuclease n=1 Tax=Rhodopila sp. TaxID=2480087 RepID=UPI003D0D143D